MAHCENGCVCCIGYKGSSHRKRSAGNHETKRKSLKMTRFIFTHSCAYGMILWYVKIFILVCIRKYVQYQSWRFWHIAESSQFHQQAIARNAWVCRHNRPYSYEQEMHVIISNGAVIIRNETGFQPWGIRTSGNHRYQQYQIEDLRTCTTTNLHRVPKFTYIQSFIRFCYVYSEYYLALLMMNVHRDLKWKSNRCNPIFLHISGFTDRFFFEIHTINLITMRPGSTTNHPKSTGNELNTHFAYNLYRLT